MYKRLARISNYAPSGKYVKCIDRRAAMRHKSRVTGMGISNTFSDTIRQ